MKILVFGAGGQLAQELAAICPQLRVTAVFCSKSECDISNIDQVAEIHQRAGPAVIINTAAYTNVERAESEPDAALRANRDGPGILAKVSADFGVPLIHVSTDFVFDGSKPSSYVESDPVAPLGVYGLSKFEGEQAIRRLTNQHIIIRTGWLYGRFGRNFLKTILDMSRNRDQLAVVADQIGTPTAGGDLASAIMAAADKAFGGYAQWGTYHFGGATDASWFDLAGGIVAAQAAFTGRRPQVAAVSSEQYPSAVRRPRNSRLNSDLFAAHFGKRGAAWQERVPEIVRSILTQ
jgi:dTDP-4-dehydrorhamnose reductase